MEWQTFAWGRLADAAAGGLIVLAVGSLAARLCRQPVRRARLVVLTLLGGVIVPGLGALPVVPRWSAGLLPAAAAVRPFDRDRGRAGRLESGPDRPRVGTGADARPRPAFPGDRDGYRHDDTGETGPREPLDVPRRSHARARRVCRGDGRAGGLVAARAGRALAGHPRGEARAGRGPRRLPRPHRAGGGAGGSARERPDRAAVHLHLGPAGDPPARGALRRGRTRRRCVTSWRTSGRTSSGATPGPGTSPAWRVSSSSINPCSGGSAGSSASARISSPTPGPPPRARPKTTPRSSSAWRGAARSGPSLAGPGDRRPAARTCIGGSSCSCRTANRWSAAAGRPGASPPSAVAAARHRRRLGPPARRRRTPETRP